MFLINITRVLLSFIGLPKKDVVYHILRILLQMFVKDIVTTLGKDVGKNFHMHHCDNLTATFECNLNSTLQQRLEKPSKRRLKKTLLQRWEKTSGKH